jgi:hypothetical protein
MHRAGDQTDEPVLLAATSFPLSPRAFYILYSLLEEGRNAPRPPTPCPAFLPSLRAIMPHLLFWTDPKVRKKHDFLQNREDVKGSCSNSISERLVTIGIFEMEKIKNLPKKT